MHALQHNEEICKALNLAVSEIRSAVDDVKVEFADEIDEVTDKLAELGDEMAGTIFDSLKSKVESKIKVLVEAEKQP